jgi:hypothetical protein
MNLPQPWAALREDAAMPTSATYVMQISQMMDGVPPVERGAQHPGAAAHLQRDAEITALIASAHEPAAMQRARADGATTESRSP